IFRSEPRSQVGPAMPSLFNCLEQFSSAAAFKNKSYTSQFKRGGREIRVVEHCQEYKRHFRKLLSDSSGRVKSVHQWHRDIGNNYIRFQSNALLQQCPTISYDPNHSKGSLKIGAQSLSEDRMVISNKNSRAGFVLVCGFHKEAHF